MATNPRTVNLGIIVPLTGADVDTWGEDDVNPNMVSLDGFLGGVQTVSVSGGSVTLTSPAGFVPTPSAGPTQAENRVLRFTGALASNMLVTLPLTGSYIVENRTTGNFLLQFRGATAATEVVAIQQGDTHTIYNDGSNVRFTDLGKVGDMEFWAGLSAMPAWVGGCTVAPYLACISGTTYNFSDFPYLANRLLGQFGGNGVTTFGVPDMAGRYPLAYDGTGARVTVAGCGINGQTMGATINAQTVALSVAQLPTITSTGSMSGSCSASGSTSNNVILSGSGFGVGGGGSFGITGAASVSVSGSASVSGAVSSTGTANLGHNNMPNTQVAGIWVIKT